MTTRCLIGVVGSQGSAARAQPPTPDSDSRDQTSTTACALFSLILYPRSRECHGLCSHGPFLHVAPAAKPFEPGSVRVAVRQPALHPAAVPKCREDGLVLAAPLCIPRALARQPEQVAPAGQLRDQRAKALPR